MKINWKNIRFGAIFHIGYLLRQFQGSKELLKLFDLQHKS